LKDLKTPAGKYTDLLHFLKSTVYMNHQQHTPSPILLKSYLFFIFVVFCTNFYAQEQTSLRVVRCNAIDQRTPVVNVYVDESNQKWVATTKDLFLLQALDLATPQKLAPGEQSVLQLPYGNHDYRFSKEALMSLIGKENAITAVFFDKSKAELWVGTAAAGAFQLRTKPTLQIINKFNNTNSKIKSNAINTILIDKLGEVWIGTDEGVLVGKGSRWSLEERLVDFARIIEHGNYTWLLGNGFIWKVNGRGEWIPVDIDLDKLEGEPLDLALDSLGRLWIASEVMTLHNPQLDEYQVFGPVQYYTSQYATCMAVDQDGTIWVGTEDKGLYAIESGAVMSVNVLVEKELSCDPSKNDAAIRLKMTGGKPPFQYAWTGGLQGDNPQNLSPGEYTVTVTDSEGKTKSAKATIANPRFSVQVTQDKIESAPNAGDGVASVKIAGSAADFTFQWDNGETTQIAKKLTTGAHTVTVTDKKGCSATGTVNIGQQALALNVEIQQVNNIACANDKNAALKVVVTGGKAPFQYQWNDAKLSGDQPKDLAPGNYQLKVTDGAGQNISAFVTIKAPEPLVATAQVQAPASTGNSDGKAIANIKGGTGTYNFKWDNGETSATATKLAPGAHTVTITDANGCTTNTSVNVSENILPLTAAIVEKNSLKCANSADAALAVQVTGGKAPFRYQWNNSNLTGDVPANLAAGTYQLTVTDAAGNTTNASVTVKAPEAITVSIQPQAPASTGNADGKAMANVKGGSGSFTFKWDNGETTATAVKLAPGKHAVTVTDGNNCTATASIDITENILPLTVALLEQTKIRCAGASEGALQVQVSGGKAPFQYQWNNPNANGDQPLGLTAGTYEITVKDAVGTTKTATITLAQPSVLAAEVKDLKMATSATVLDGKATAVAKGGTGTYTYQWNNGETTAAATKLPPGNNSVTVTDGNGCKATANFETPQRILAALSGQVRSGQTIRMEQLQFEADSSTINEPSLPVLKEVTDFLQENPSIFIEIGGHTNNLPPDEVCDRLSTARAKSVVDYLIQQGVDGKRLSFKGYGKRVPIADNRTPEGRQQNQRVEIKILRVGRPKEEGGG
jgi:outer membrane protein OmpA-like peptidoglycan-associated protein